MINQLRGLLKALYIRYKRSVFSDEHGGPQIYVLASIMIFLLLGLFATFAYAHKIQIMATRLHDAINSAAITSLGDNTALDPEEGKIKVVDSTRTQQEFISNLQSNLKTWPASSFELYSVQVFSEIDRGSSPPIGFTQDVPGTSIYLTMDMNVTIFPGFIPMSNTHWSIPVRVMVTPNSYESSTGSWNLVRT